MKALMALCIGYALMAPMMTMPVQAKEPAPWNPLRYLMLSAEEESAAETPAKPEPEKHPTGIRTQQGLVDPLTVAAVLQTERGDITFSLYPEEAPKTVENFVQLVSRNFYNTAGMKFHRVVPGFVVQTGDPTGTGYGGSEKSIPLEAKNKLSHNQKGMVAMARSLDPNSATSQFYITLAPQTSLDGKYAIFGKVISGLSVLDQIRQGDRVYGVRLVPLSAVVPESNPDKKPFKQALKDWATGKL